MDSDQLSIASDFSIIPESLVYLEEIEQEPAPMNVSFFQSSSSSYCDKVAVRFGPISKVGCESNISLSIIFWYSDEFKPSSSDRIALYKIGFSSTKDFVCYKWAPVSGSSMEASAAHRSHTVDFEAEMLPNDHDGFYQICYLMKNGNILGVSTTFTLKQTEPEIHTNEVEEAARNVLSVRIRELVRDNTELRETLETDKNEGELIKLRYEELQKEQQECQVEKEHSKKLVQNLKETVNDCQVEIEKLKMEILFKEKEIKREILLNQEVQGRLTETVLHLNDLREKISESVEEKSICEERHQVLMEDNQELKENLRLVKEELETTIKEKVAAEKIASDFSQELQTAHQELSNLTLLNLKLTKKIKKLRRVIALMEATNNDDFICVEEDSEERRDEEEEKTEDGAISSSMSASVSGVLSQCPSSTCSQKLNETVVSVKKTMDEIVHQLNEQTEEMKSLKREISRKTLEGAVGSLVTPPGSLGTPSGSLGTPSGSLGTPSGSLDNPVKEDLKKDGGKKEELHGSEDKVLYEHCFLPAHCTAPVFLPAPKDSPKRAGRTPKPTPRNAIPSAPSMIEDEATELPRPLRPVETDTARNAAVLRHFSESGSDQLDSVIQQPRQASIVQQPRQDSIVQHPRQDSIVQQPRQDSVVQQPRQDNVAQQPRQDNVAQQPRQDNVVQQPRQQSPNVVDPSAAKQESDDEDYHSTGDAGEQPFNCMPSSFKCPMCPLEFLPSGIHLLNEHINNHLDRTCPVCSLAFQRSTPQDKFEEHVQSHFEDENDPSVDPSGPWDPRDSERSFQLLEID